MGKTCRSMTAWTLAVIAVSCGGLPHQPSGGPATAWLSSKGFPERAAWPSAILHLSREEIPDTARISDLLRAAPELNVLPPEGEGWGVHEATSNQQPGCELAVLLNGNDSKRIALFGARRLLTMDAAFQAKDLDGLEVHLGREGPTRDGLECGVVLLWVEAKVDPPTRQGRGVA